MPPKVGVHPREDAFIHAMPAYLADTDAVGLKWVAGYPSNQPLGIPYIHGLFVLSDAATGRPLAVMDATWITEVRTAAASILGIRALAEKSVEAIGIIGCGRQGQAHLELAEQVFPTLRRAALFDRHRERADALAAAHPKLEVEVASAAEEIAPGADVIVTTAAIVRQPERPLRRAHLKDAMVACAVDFDASLSEDLFEDAGIFVVDDVAPVRYPRAGGHRGGSGVHAAARGEIGGGGAPHGRGGGICLARGRARGDGGGGGDIQTRGGDAGGGRPAVLVDQPLFHAVDRHAPHDNGECHQHSPLAEGPSPRTRSTRVAPVQPSGGAGSAGRRSARPPATGRSGRRCRQRGTAA